ncbi:membrane protein [Streptomyces toyocaensis]|uniref:Membrane protein n=1 Tax=Streptomyces toyocaensis TaxID=55952 RepID=A0A081XUQ6_STRTO|nr:hypothetical protein [Streptomyces toyocaensis]KES07279.1 membrane protein [Streptomyces toyocaensis]
MTTERPDNDDAEARAADGSTRDTGGASDSDGETGAPGRRDGESPTPAAEKREPATPEQRKQESGTAEPRDREPAGRQPQDRESAGAEPDTTEPDAGAEGPGEDGPEPGGDETLVAGHPAGGPRSGEEPAGGQARRRSPALIASVAAAVLLVGGGGAYLAASTAGGSGGGGTAPGANGDATPPPLVLDGHSEDATNGIAPGEPNPYGATYRADGPLPGGPGSAPVHRFRGQVTRQQVVTLAEALGLEGKPVAEGGSWRIGGQDGSGPTLRVDREAPGSWTYSRSTPGTDNCKGATCKPPSGGGGPAVSEAAAKKAAAPVLKAAGQDDAKLDASQIMGGNRVVNADPEVGGLPTYGWTTGVVVGAGGEVVGGNGRLAEPVKGDVYPTVSAGRALALMNAAPGAGRDVGIGGCASPVPLDEEQGGTSCGTPGISPEQDTLTVQKAVFGLAAHSVDGRPALVPSWLFEVVPPNARGTLTVTHPAVDPRYIASAAPSGEASPAPSGPGDRPTAAPSTREADVEGYTAEGDELTVTFTGGVCADYRATASEKGGEVTVRVTETPWPDKVCILIAKQYQQTVRLDGPLGGREVVDTDGEPVPLRKDGARLPAPPTR